MKYQIIDTAEKAVSMLLTAEKNEITWKRMFSNKDLYLRWLWNMCFGKASRVVGVFNQWNFCLGYLVMSMGRMYESNELFVHDLFVMPEERKTKVSEYLYECVRETMMSINIKQLRWCSSAIPQEYWEGKLFGFKVNTIKYYTIDIDDEARRHYENLSKNSD